MPHSGARSRVAIACRSFSGALAGSSSRAAGCADASLWRTQPGCDSVPGFLWYPGGGAASEQLRCAAGGTDSDTLSPIQTAGRMALPSFSMGNLAVRVPLVHAVGTAELCGARKCLPVSHSYQGSPENCFRRRRRQRADSTAGGARELIPPQVVLSTKSLDGCIIMLSAAGDSRLLIPNKGVSRHEVFHLPCCI